MEIPHVPQLDITQAICCFSVWMLLFMFSIVTGNAAKVTSASSQYTRKLCTHHRIAHRSSFFKSSGIFTLISSNYSKRRKNKTRSIQRTQTPPLLWPWRVTLTLLQGQETYVIRCRLLYCALVPGIKSMNVIVCEIWPFIHFVRPLTFTCDLQFISWSLSL